MERSKKLPGLKLNQVPGKIRNIILIQQLHIKAEVHHVAIRYHIFFTLDA